MKPVNELREAISSTLDSLKIDRKRAVIIGGAGLADYGIATHRGVRAAITREGNYVYRPFDVDALLPPDDFINLRQKVGDIPGTNIGGTTIDIAPQHPDLLPFTGILFSQGMEEAMREENILPVTTGEITTLPASELAKQKNNRSEPRDTVGLTLGHKDA